MVDKVFDMRERLASDEHERWARWMRYQLEQGEYVNDKDEVCWLMPSDKLKRWTRQMNTPYDELSENEKNSDREEADRILALLNTEGDV